MKPAPKKALLSILSLASLVGCTSNFSEKKTEFITRFNQVSPNFSYSSGGGIALYGFGGLGGNITDRIARKTREEVAERGYSGYGIKIETVNLDQLPEKSKEIFKDIYEGKDFVFLAHSLGCREATEAASMLNELDVPVMLVLMDPFAFDKTIPQGVYKVINYRSRDPFLNGRALTERDIDSKTTKLVNDTLGTGHNSFREEIFKEVIAHDIAQSLEEKLSHYFQKK